MGKPKPEPKPEPKPKPHVHSYDTRTLANGDTYHFCTAGDGCTRGYTD